MQSQNHLVTDEYLGIGRNRNGSDTMEYTITQRNRLHAIEKYAGNQYFTRTTQKEQRMLYKMKKYEEAQLGYFASSKFGNEYTVKLNTSLSRLKDGMRRNLYAIVMPAGHGKSSLSRRYGVMDIDDLVSARIHNVLVDMRYDLLANNKPWIQHNNYWYGKVRETLDTLDLSKATVLMVHSEETALELGAEVLRTIVLTPEALEFNIAKREPMEKMLARINRETVLHSRYEPAVICRSFADVEKEFLNVMNANKLPVGAPYKYSREYDNIHYSVACPEWVLTGELPQKKYIHDVVDYFKKGMVPKECVDYYVGMSNMEAMQGFGTTMNHWGKLMGEIADAITPREKFDTSEIADVNKIFPFAEAKEQNRANTTIRRLLKAVPNLWEHEDVLAIAEHHKGSRNIFVANLIVHWKGCMHDEEIAPIVRRWYYVGEFHFTEIMKRVHALVRTSDYIFHRKITEPQRQKLMYMDLLIGRKSYTISRELAVGDRDQAEFIPDRVAYDDKTNMWTKDEYKKMFMEGLSASLVRIRAKPRVIKPSSFLEFWRDSRRTWVTQGGLGYNKLESWEKKYVTIVMDEMNGVCSELVGRHTKGTVFETRDLFDIIDERAENFNKTLETIKYEVGARERVLNAGSLTHYIFFSYILYWAEKQEQVGSVRLNAPNDDDIRYFDRKMAPMYHLLYDWASFNEGHSAWEMAMIVESLTKEELGQPKDMWMFVNAISEAMYNMKHVFEDEDGEKEVIHVKKGLMSGWRGTTWINTVANFVYKYIGYECYRRLYGQTSLVYIDGGGDDVDEAFTDGADPLRVLHIMNRIGFDAKMIKQMIAEKSEFFRVTITDEGTFASVTRGLASFCAGDWETAGRTTIREKVQSTLDQVSKLVRRGLDHEVGNILITGALAHWTRLKTDDGWLDLPREVWHGTKECGGLEIPDENGELWILDGVIAFEHKDSGKKYTPDQMASNDYVMSMSTELAKYGLEIRRFNDLVNKMANDQFQFAEESDRAQWLEVVKKKFNKVGTVQVIRHRDNAALFEVLMDHKPDESLQSAIQVAAKYEEIAGYLAFDGKNISQEALLQIVTGGRVRQETLQFQGNPHYRRIVPDYWGVKIMSLCQEGVNACVLSLHEAQEYFETMCSMVNRRFTNMM